MSSQGDLQDFRLYINNNMIISNQDFLGVSKA